MNSWCASRMQGSTVYDSLYVSKTGQNQVVRSSGLPPHSSAGHGTSLVRLHKRASNEGKFVVWTYAPTSCKLIYHTLFFLSLPPLSSCVPPQINNVKRTPVDTVFKKVCYNTSPPRDKWAVGTIDEITLQIKLHCSFRWSNFVFCLFAPRRNHRSNGYELISSAQAISMGGCG